MSHQPGNLSGVWHGRYSYPNEERPAAPFTALLHDSGEALTGTIFEAEPLDGQLQSTIMGSVRGGAVSFVKAYDDAPVTYDEVLYEGTLSADNDEVEGVWRIPGVWSGRFLMIRQRGDGVLQGDYAHARA